MFNLTCLNELRQYGTLEDGIAGFEPSVCVCSKGMGMA